MTQYYDIWKLSHLQWRKEIVKTSIAQAFFERLSMTFY